MLLLLLDSDVTLMLRLALCTSVHIPNATKARMTKRTMIMMAMTSFFLTMVTGKGSVACYCARYRNRKLSGGLLAPMARGAVRDR